jgi:adenylate cyclase
LHGLGRVAGSRAQVAPEPSTATARAQPEGDRGIRTIRLPGTELIRHAARRVNEAPSLEAGMEFARRLLPGDPDFGDPLSTMSTEPVHAVARRAYQISEGRLSLLGQVGLAVLQVANWIQDGGHARPREVAIAFTDLVGFSDWAVDMGDEAALDLLRRVGVVMEATVESRNGRVVKRLGDGTMVVFDTPDAAIAGTKEALEAVADLRCDGYRPQLRAGVHFGEPTRIGGDYLGVDVTVAARLCEAADDGEILLSEEVAGRIDDDTARVWQPATVLEKGTPENLRVFRIGPD